MSALNLPDLRRLLLHRCTLDDLKNLAYDLGIDDEEEQKSHLTRTLLTWAETHDQLDDLLVQLQANRPDLFKENE